MAAKNVCADALRAQILKQMPRPLRERYFALRHDVLWLHVKWTNCLALYGQDQKTIDLLNVSAQAFFRDLRQVLWEDIVLHLCRLTDPTKQGAKKLTLETLYESVQDIAVKNKLRPMLIDL